MQVQIAVRSQVDVEHARREARTLAESAGFGREDAECVALATVELATNLARYAQAGELVLKISQNHAIEIESRDSGPGISNLDSALEDGFSTGGGLGGGLPAVRRLMDEFSMTTGPHGTHVIARKWTSKRP